MNHIIHLVNDVTAAVERNSEAINRVNTIVTTLNQDVTILQDEIYANRVALEIGDILKEGISFMDRYTSSLIQVMNHQFPITLFDTRMMKQEFLRFNNR